MRRIAVVTDTISYIPQSARERCDIKVVPLSVVFEDKVYIDDGKSIKQDDFYKMIENSDQMPKVSTPAPGSFLKAYTGILAGSVKG